MVTHWESSRRPLYVKTIWKDGQHHVILDQTKETSLETSLSRKTSQCFSNQNSHRSMKSATTGVNLKVSSVRVLLSGVNRFKNAETNARFQENVVDKPKIWIQSSVTRPVTSKNLNKEVTFNVVRGTKAPNLYKSSTIDSCITIEKPSEPATRYLADNALSEKVMIWLDLASQNGHIDTEVKQDGAVTAHACQLVKKPRKHSSGTRDAEEDEEVISSSILKNASPRPDSVKEGMIVYSNVEAEVLDDFYHVLTPTIDDDSDYEQKWEDNKKRINTAKRQLHIFMPNLPKRTSDCDSSILSSQV